MAIRINDTCHSDAITALDALRAEFPIYIGTTTPVGVWLSSSSINMTTGVFTYSTKNQAGAILNTNVAVTYPICTDTNANLPQQIPDLIFVSALVVLFALGFIAGKFR